MKPPDATDDPKEWSLIKDHTPALWENLVHENVFSDNKGKTFWISTDRTDPYCRRDRYPSRKVKK